MGREGRIQGEKSKMEIKLKRNFPTTKSTIGTWFMDSRLICFTLEDVDRFLETGGEKIPGKTAIPRGRYRIVIDESTRFKRPMIHILDVPQFDGIRVHTGGSPEDTEGCIIVGMQTGQDSISDSWHAFGLVMCWLIFAVQKKEEVWITIE